MIFEEVLFVDGARFDDALFPFVARFNNATFSSHAWFTNSKFSNAADFCNTRFAEGAPFGELKSDYVDAPGGPPLSYIFGEPTFVECLRHDGDMAVGESSVRMLKFTQGVRFDGAEFGSARPDFSGATLLHSPLEDSLNLSSWPAGWQIASDHVVIEGRAGTWHNLFEG